MEKQVTVPRRITLTTPIDTPQQRRAERARRPHVLR
jgi:hypothetical protein